MIPYTLLEYTWWLTIKSNVKDSVFLKFYDQRKLLLLYKIKSHLQAVGGLTKAAIQWEVGAGRNMTCTEEMLSLIKIKFSKKSNPLYIFTDTSSEDLDEERKIDRF